MYSRCWNSLKPPNFCGDVVFHLPLSVELVEGVSIMTVEAAGKTHPSWLTTPTGACFTSIQCLTIDVTLGGFKENGERESVCVCVWWGGGGGGGVCSIHINCAHVSLGKYI